MNFVKRPQRDGSRQTEQIKAAVKGVKDKEKEIKGNRKRGGDCGTFHRDTFLAKWMAS
jgi:hypothetical protein